MLDRLAFVRGISISEYTPLAPDHGSEKDEEEFSRSAARPSRTVRSRYILVVLGVVLLTSIAANIFFIQRQYLTLGRENVDPPSRFAGLHRNVPTEIGADTNHTSSNRTLQDAAYNSFNQWDGFVALDESYTIEQDLPTSQRWPWDLSKGIYVMASVHEMHCVHILRDTINAYHDGVQYSDRQWTYEHELHCLNVLRDTVMCNADDTPLYAGIVHKNALYRQAKPGLGTMKMCRDWNAMLTWSRARNACYNADLLDESAGLERYKFCPDGSRPWEKTEEHLVKAHLS